MNIDGMSDKQKEQYELMMSRQSEIVKDTSDKRVLIIGGGGLGSNGIDLLASMGVLNFTVIDFDEVGKENIFPGYFPSPEIGMPKTAAIKMQTEATYPLTTVVRIDGDLMELQREMFKDAEWDVVIACTDKLDSRRYAFSLFADRCDWWLDARMGGTGCNIFCIDTGNTQQHETYLQYEFEPITKPQPCGLKATAGITTGYFRGMLWEIFIQICNGDAPPYDTVFTDDGELLRVNLEKEEDGEEEEVAAEETE